MCYERLSCVCQVHVDTDHPHTKALLARLRFLKVVVCDTRLPLNFAAAHRVWVALTAKPCCPEDVEVCYAWFTLADVPFLDNDAAVQMYTKEVLLLDAATCTDAAFRCFESFFRTTNGASRKIDVLHTGFCVYDLNLQGKGVLLDIAFRCPENSIAMKAIDMVKRIYTSLSDSLRTRQVVCNGQLLEVAIDHMQRAHHVLQGASQGTLTWLCALHDCIVPCHVCSSLRGVWLSVCTYNSAVRRQQSTHVSVLPRCFCAI